MIYLIYREYNDSCACHPEWIRENIGYVETLEKAQAKVNEFNNYNNRFDFEEIEKL